MITKTGKTAATRVAPFTGNLIQIPDGYKYRQFLMRYRSLKRRGVLPSYIKLQTLGSRFILTTLSMKQVMGIFTLNGGEE